MAEACPAGDTGGLISTNPSAALAASEPTALAPAAAEAAEAAADGCGSGGLRWHRVGNTLHELDALGTSRDNGWSCSGMTYDGGSGRVDVDGCKKGCTGFHQTGGWKRWRCAPCDFDLCEGTSKNHE